VATLCVSVLIGHHQIFDRSPELKIDPEDLGYLVTTANAWMTNYPEDTSFWIDYGVGKRICAWLAGAMEFQQRAGWRKPFPGFVKIEPDTRRSAALGVNGTLNGSGSNLTNLTAANITVGKINGNQLRVPLQLSGDLSVQAIVSAINNKRAGAGIYGRSNLTNAGSTFSTGVYGENIGKGNGVYGTTNNDNDSRAGVQGYAPMGDGVIGTGGRVGVLGSSDTGLGVYGISNGSNTGAGVGGFNNSSTGKAIWGLTSSPTGFAGYFDGKVHVNGAVGIGTTAPTANLHISSTSTSSTSMVLRMFANHAS
jgi:hypothetical protein